ncbi:MAG: LPS export ABC transporter permease LptG [Bdellovibrionales bacterium]|nr:LPS export ABC transporter permease LptG [Bdellovibrionales bacterium]
MLLIIDKYVAKLFILFFGAGLLIFTTLFLAVDFLSFAARFSDAGFDALLKYYGYFTPSIIYQMIPVASLLSTVFTLSTLNKSNELVALFSSGMSLARVSAPMLVIVAGLSVFSFWLGDRVLPHFEQKKNYVYYVELKKKPGLYSTVNTDKIWYRSENILFNIQTLNPDDSTAQGMTLYYFNEAWDLVQLITAKTVSMLENVWVLKNGTVTLFVQDESFPLTKSFKEKQISMNEDVADLKASSRASTIMSLGELRRFIKKNKEAGLDTIRYEVDYHSKFGFAFASLVMALMGIPFSVSKQRSGGLFVNAGICIALAFLYWALYSSAITLGKHGVISPFFAAWVPNILSLSGSIYLLLRLNK